MNILFVGLGVMGAPMAGHLARAGHRVDVYNRTASKAQAWVTEHGGRSFASPAEGARDADVVLTCVGNDDDLRGLLLGPGGVLAAMKPGALFADHTTASAQVARDAPVSGGEAGAINGVLTVMCGGSPEAFAAAEPVFAAYARRTGHLGPAGSGQLAKMVNQICIAGLVEGLAEALNFAMAAGLDAGAVVDVISQGAAQSWQMDNRATTMIAGKFDFGFAVDWMRKDLGLVLAEATRLGIGLPVTALVDQFYAEVQGKGGGRLDTSSLIKRYR